MSARSRSLLTLVGVVASVVSVGALAPAATGEELRTESNLGGFSISANAAPLKILLDDPSLPIPRPDDSAVVEADPAYTQADLATGPASFGLASTLWPGNLLGTGLPTASGDQLGQYPLKTEARYPDKPFTADGTIVIQHNKVAETNGAIMRAEALGLDASAMARFNPSDIPGQIDVGGLLSRTAATVTTSNVAVGRSTSTVSDVSLLAGLIKIGSVSTHLETTSDGEKAASSGSTAVTGLTVGPVGYTVDDKGARPVGVPVPGLPTLLPPGTFDPAKAAGITIEGIAQTATQDSETSTRRAKGLRITVETTILRGVLNGTTPAPVTQALYSIFNNAPPAQRGRLYYLLAATPKITFILGAGESTSSANLPIDFDFGVPPVVDEGGFPTTPDRTGTPGGTGTFSPPTLPGGVIAPTMPEAGPGIGQPDPVLAGSPSFPRSPPVSALLVLGALVMAAFGAYGLTWLRGFAFGAGLLGAGCAMGAPSSIPSLHAMPPVKDGV